MKDGIIIGISGAGGVCTFLGVLYSVAWLFQMLFDAFSDLPDIWVAIIALILILWFGVYVLAIAIFAGVAVTTLLLVILESLFE